MTCTINFTSALALLFFTLTPGPFPLTPSSADPPPQVRYKTAEVDDLDIFYREAGPGEAGPKDAPTILLLHGFPTSSQMFRNLIPALADKYHVIAPDYPGFGQSSMPPPRQVLLHVR